MNNILCIDIGGTRIKAGILKENMSLEKLKNTTVKTMGTLGWMNISLPEIISKDNPFSLINEYKSLRNYDYISIGIPLMVEEKGQKIKGHYVDINGVPGNLLELIKKQANCDVVITNDSIGWMNGALRYFQLSSTKVEFPCLAIILGTGVGVAYADSYNSIHGIEISLSNNIFPSLSNTVNEEIHKGGRIHEFLGEKFFNHVKHFNKNWSYLKIQDEYTNILIALFKDLDDAELYNFKNVKSIIISGGNSKYISYSVLKSALNKTLYLLNNNYINVDPDLISLLGLFSLATKQP